VLASLALILEGILPGRICRWNLYMADDTDILPLRSDLN